jgi:hypothetical protein
MTWTNRQLLIGICQLTAVVCILILSVIASPLALIAMIALAVPTLGVSAVVGFLALMFLVIALLR